MKAHNPLILLAYSPSQTIAKVGVEGSNPFARSNFSKKLKRLTIGHLRVAFSFSVWCPHGVHHAWRRCGRIAPRSARHPRQVALNTPPPSLREVGGGRGWGRAVQDIAAISRRCRRNPRENLPIWQTCQAFLLAGAVVYVVSPVRNNTSGCTPNATETCHMVRMVGLRLPASRLLT
jgi:hypothetical protein